MPAGRGHLPADQPTEGAPPVSVGAVTLDVSMRRLRLPPSGRVVTLTPLQAALLAYLMTRSGRTCTRQELMCDALGYASAVDSRTVDVHVRRLRAKLGQDYDKVIATVRNVGYKAVDFDNEPTLPAARSGH